MTGDHEPRRRTDDGLITEGITTWRERGDGAIDDTTARIIASHWHGGQSSAFYSFASSGRIDEDGVAAELMQSLQTAETEEDTEQLEALGRYFVEHGDRDAIEGWHDLTKWGRS